jgi:hypothetical protein
VEDPNELRQEASDQLQVPVRSILYQPVTVHIHYPKSNTWSQEVIEDLRACIVAEDRQGGLQVIRSWKVTVQDAISGLAGEYNLSLWNWDKNRYLGYIKMFPLAWRIFIRLLYFKICNGSPVRDYMLTNLYANQEELRGARGSMSKIIDKYVENVFSAVF